jgi:hypothetical protein
VAESSVVLPLLYQGSPYDQYPADCSRDGLVELAIMLQVRNNDGAYTH